MKVGMEGGYRAGTPRPGEYERIVVAIDDTDDLTKATSTGFIAQLAVEELDAIGGELVLGITRHQLLLRDDIPYTSHNSAMAFEARIPTGSFERYRGLVAAVVDANRAETANPGICLARIDVASGPAAEDERGRIVAFGMRAQQEFCPVDSAVEIAASIPWVVLEKREGNGDGMVGALAGVGLRLTGEDGRFRGKWKLAKRWPDAAPITVGEAMGRLAGETGGTIMLVDRDFKTLDPAMPFDLGVDAKPLLRAGALVMVCHVDGDGAHPLEKDELKSISDDELAFGNELALDTSPCTRFEWDNDSIEFREDGPSCLNCLYRRWLGQGFTCVLGESPGPRQDPGRDDGAGGGSGTGRGDGPRCASRQARSEERMMR